MKQNIETLKDYFETGDKPSQQNYADLIDSLGMPMIGEIKATSFAFTPHGWVKCNGQLLDPAAYPVLFALIGTTYGGDGTTSFAVPNLIAKVPLGYGNTPGLSSYTIGQTGGEETVILTEDQLPAHSHDFSISYSTDTASREIPSAGDVVAVGETNVSLGDPTPLNLYGNATNIVQTSDSTSNSGTGNSQNNLQPFVAVNYIIAVEGINPM